jgi:hypothetical protein
MKKLIIILTGMAVMSSCATSKVEETTKNESRETKKALIQAEIKQAVEMRTFIIKFDRLYTSRGGMVDLIPKANYIIVNGDKVVISAAYIGQQYGFRPVKGIDMRGRAVSFELKNNTTKGLYEITMKVKNESNTFDVYLTVKNDGNCNTSLASYRIDHVRYTGTFVPIMPKEDKEIEKLPENAVPENMSI